MAYDANGNVITQTDRAGRVTQMTYDRANRLIETIYPDDTASTADNPRTRSVYNAGGQLIESIDEKGNRTRYEYDDAGRQIKTIQAPVGAAAAAIQTTEYDATGRRTRSIDANGGITTYTYDAGGRLTETQADNGSETTREYDRAGRKTAEINAEGERSEFAYDALGRLTEVRQFIAGRTLTTRYAFDEVGNKISQTDALGRVTRWEFDAMGREIARVLPGGQRETKRYNAAGELVEHVDFKGEATTNAYDPAGRLIRTAYADGRIETFAFDAAGNRTAMTSTEGATSWVYDSRHRVIRETQPSGAVIEYGYDLAGNRTLTRHIQGSVITENRYTFDVQQRLESAQEGAGEPTVYRYDLAGNLIEEMQGDTLTRHRYDRLNRLVEIHSTTSGTTMQRYVYTLDAIGRRTNVEETDADGVQHVTDYGYDDLGRLISESETVAGSGVSTSSYAYDDVGNRTSISENGTTKSATFDVNDRLLTQGSAQFTYDANGNQIGKTEASATVVYTYDDRGRLTAANDSAAALSVQFDYDPDGNRIARRSRVGASPEVETRFVIDRSFGLPEVIAELDASGAITARYLHGYQLIQQRTLEGANSVLRYPLRDGLGSTRYLVNNQGSVTDAIRYTPWGELREREGNTALTHRFAGEAWEERLGLSYNRARWLDPSTGRFTQMDDWMGDPMRPLTLNKMLYGDADPANRMDPTGHFSMTEMMSTVNTAMTLYNNAMTTISFIDPDLAERIDSETPSVMDFIFPVVIRAAASGFGSNASPSGIDVTMSAGGSGIEMHHPIPVYLCGRDAGQKLVPLYRADHWFLHGELAAFAALVEVSGNAYKFAFSRGRKTSPDRQYIVRAARTKSGRSAISAGIASIYYGSDYWNYSLGGFTPLGQVFSAESAEFVAHRSKTSYGMRCSRTP